MTRCIRSCSSFIGPILEVKVSLSAETLALHGDVIDVLDKVRSVGIEKIGYQIKTASVQGAAGTVPRPPLRRRRHRPSLG